MASTEKKTARKDLKLTKSEPKDISQELRNIPQALGPEKGVLALMAMDPASYIGQAITLGLSEDYFYLPAHKIIWNIFQSRYSKNEPIDIVSVAQVLTDNNQLEAVGGNSGLAEIYTYTTTSAYFGHYINILKDKYILRSIINTANECTNQAFDNPEDVAQLLETLEGNIFQIRERYNTSKDGTNLKQILEEALSNFEKFLTNKGVIQGQSTGYEKLDKMCNGLKPGDMFIIAARPSMGKTSFLLNIIEHIALNEKKPVLLFSCEMPAVQIAERLLYARSGIKRAEIIKRGNLSPLEMKRFSEAYKEMDASRLVIDDTAAISINELRAKARRVMRDQGELAAIGVDYLQLMRSHSQQAVSSREREVAEISSGLKALAKELKVPVIVLAQLNRGPESRTGNSLGVPRMSDLRESGSIEQDADMIGLLYRSAYYAEDEEARQKNIGRANLNLAKNRNGETGDVPLHFEAELMRFTSREPDENDLSGN